MLITNNLFFLKPSTLLFFRWRRETRIKSFSRSGVRGEVIYYAPCGKKLRSYPEVVRVSLNIA